MKKEAIPKDILERVEAELLSGEKLLWVGKPSTSRMLQIAPRQTPTWLSILLSLELAGLLGLLFASGGRAPIWLFGALILLLIVTAAWADIARRYWKADKTIYAVTNERALIIEGADVNSFGAANLQQIKRRKNDLIFKSEQVHRNLGYGLGAVSETLEEGFMGIEAPEQVELLLMETFMRKAKHPERLMLEETAADDIALEEESKGWLENHPR